MRPRYNTVIEGIERMFTTNFAGNPNRYGQTVRNFGIVLTQESAEQLENEGWSVKHYGEEEDLPVLYVTIKYGIDKNGNVKPNIYRCLDGDALHMDEEMVGSLDEDNITNANLMINPYWGPRKNKEVDAPTAYLEVGYFEVDPVNPKKRVFSDPFADRYGH